MRISQLAVPLLLTACGRMGFEPLDEDLQQEPGGGGAGTGAGRYDTCAQARVIAPGDAIITGTLVGARDDLPATGSCGDGPEIMLRFSGAARGLALRVDPAFHGAYAVGTGCPLDPTRTLVCGPLVASALSPTVRLDVDEHTYVILSHSAGAAGGFTLLTGEAAR